MWCAIYAAIGIAGTQVFTLLSEQKLTAEDHITRLKKSLEDEVGPFSNEKKSAKLTADDKKSKLFLYTLISNDNYVQNVIRNGESLGLIVDKKLKSKKDLGF